MKDYTIIYIYDALCGWCYGFSPVIQQIQEKYKDEMNFTVLSGGMIMGERVGPIGQVAGYIKQAYKTVEERTGVEFGEDFLNNILDKGEAIFNSYPPSVALTVFKTYQPENAVAFAGTLQKAIYQDGIKPEDFQAYGQYAARFGIDADEFVNKMQEEKFKNATFAEFQQVTEWGIQGFPSVIMATPENLYLLARGYMPFGRLDRTIQQVLAEEISSQR